VRKIDRSARSDMVRRSEDRDIIVDCIRYPPYPLPHQQQQAWGQHRTGKSPLPCACIFSLVKENFSLPCLCLRLPAPLSDPASTSIDNGEMPEYPPCVEAAVAFATDLNEGRDARVYC
jgi:hypothetical protein